MTDRQKEIMAAVVLMGCFIIPEIDAAFITSKMKESAAILEAECHNHPDKCWLQQKRHK